VFEVSGTTRKVYNSNILLFPKRLDCTYIVLEYVILAIDLTEIDKKKKKIGAINMPSFSKR